MATNVQQQEANKQQPLRFTDLYKDWQLIEQYVIEKVRYGVIEQVKYGVGSIVKDGEAKYVGQYRRRSKGQNIRAPTKEYSTLEDVKAELHSIHEEKAERAKQDKLAKARKEAKRAQAAKGKAAAARQGADRQPLSQQQGQHRFSNAHQDRAGAANSQHNSASARHFPGQHTLGVMPTNHFNSMAPLDRSGYGVPAASDYPPQHYAPYHNPGLPFRPASYAGMPPPGRPYGDASWEHPGYYMQDSAWAGGPSGEGQQYPGPEGSSRPMMSSHQQQHGHRRAGRGDEDWAPGGWQGPGYSSTYDPSAPWMPPGVGSAAQQPVYQSGGRPAATRLPAGSMVVQNVEDGSLFVLRMAGADGAAGRSDPVVPARAAAGSGAGAGAATPAAAGGHVAARRRSLFASNTASGPAAAGPAPNTVAQAASAAVEPAARAAYGLLGPGSRKRRLSPAPAQQQLDSTPASSKYKMPRLDPGMCSPQPASPAEEGEVPGSPAESGEWVA